VASPAMTATETAPEVTVIKSPPMIAFPVWKNPKLRAREIKKDSKKALA